MDVSFHVCVFYLCVLWQVEDGVQPLCVMVSGLLFVRQISVTLRQRQKPPDGAQVLPQSAVLWAGVLLPPEQLAQPSLEERHGRTRRNEMGGLKSESEVESGRCQNNSLKFGEICLLAFLS